MKIIKFTIFALALACLSSCAYLNKEQGYIDDKPQNIPAGWERDLIGVQI